jgi:4-amino-4-deoxy-L-arabinose transferase-like glycosyltransferase
MAFKNFTSSRALFLILALGLIVRLLIVFLIPNYQESDGFSYKVIAIKTVIKGAYFNGRYRAYTAPGYPVFLSFFYLIGSASDITIKVVQVLFSTAAIFVLYKLVRIFFDEKTALWSAFFLAVYFNQAAYCSMFFTEVIFTFLLLLIGWLTRLEKTKTILLVLTLSISWMVFIKPQSLVLAILMIIGSGLRKKEIQAYAIAFTVCIILVMAWMFRNQQLIGKFVFTSNQAVNLFIGNNDKATGRYADTGLRDDIGEAEQMEYYRDQLKAHPMPLNKMPALLFNKLWYLYCTDADALRYWISAGIPDLELRAKVMNWRWVCLVEYLIIIAGLIFFCVALISGNYRIRWMFIIPLLFFTFLHLIYFGNARFHYPAMPFLLPYVFLGWEAVVKQIIRLYKIIQ